MKIRRVLWILIAATAAAVPLKTYHLVHGSDSSVSVALLLSLIVVVGTSLVMMIAGLTEKKYPFTMPKKKATVLGVVALLTAFAVGAGCVRAILLPGSSDFSGALGLICYCAGLLSSFAFLYLSLCSFKRPKQTENLPLLFAVPVLWFAFRVVLTYLVSMKKHVGVDYYIELVALVLMLLFSVSAAKFASGAGGNSSKWAFAMGAPAILLTLVRHIPPMFVGEYSGVSDVLIALTAAGFLFCISVKRPKRPQEETRALPAPENDGYNDFYKEPEYRPQRQRYAFEPMYAREEYPPIESEPLPVRREQYTTPGEDRYTSMGAGVRVTEKFEVRQQPVSVPTRLSRPTEDIPFSLGVDVREPQERAYLPTPQMYTPSLIGEEDRTQVQLEAELGLRDFPSDYPNSRGTVPLEQTLDYGESDSLEEPKPEPQVIIPEPKIEEPAPAETRNVTRAGGKLSERF